MSYAFINMDGNYMLELDDEILIEANAVAELERERIIKLLEGMSCGHYCRCMDGELCDSYAEAIALIKGEDE